MPALRSQPHSLTLIRPKTTRDANNNVTQREYTVGPTGATQRTAVGLFQTRAGRKFVADSGEVYAYDALFYSRETDFANNDLMVVQAGHGGGLDGTKFIVLGVEIKHGLRGQFDHVEVLLSKEAKR